MRTTKAAAVNPAPPAAEWENVGSQEPIPKEKSHTATKARPTSKASWARPATGWESRLNGQFPKVKPVKMKARIAQKSSAPTAAWEAPKGLHFGSPSNHHVTTDTIQMATVTTTGVAAPHRGTAVSGATSTSMSSSVLRFGICVSAMVFGRTARPPPSRCRARDAAGPRRRAGDGGRRCQVDDEVILSLVRPNVNTAKRAKL